MKDYAFHPEAFDDLDEIWEHIAADDIDAADRVVADIFDVIRSLPAFPDRGHRRSDLSAGPLRFVHAFDYLIAYAPDEDPVWIIAILHGRRNPRVLAAILRDRERQ